MTWLGRLICLSWYWKMLDEPARSDRDRQQARDRASGTDDRQRGVLVRILELRVLPRDQPIRTLRPMTEQSTTRSTSEDLYTNLGYLFYSVAASDRRVPLGEADKLKEEVAVHWLPYEKSRDEFGTDAAYYIEFSFDEALHEHLRADEAFERFRSFYVENRDRFAASERQRILETAAAIASAVGGNNKAELTCLVQLTELLRE